MNLLMRILWKGKHFQMNSWENNFLPFSVLKSKFVFNFILICAFFPPWFLIHIDQRSWKDKLSSYIFSRNWQFGKGERPWLLFPQEKGKQNSVVTLHILWSIHQHTHIHTHSQANRQGSSSALELALLLPRQDAATEDSCRWECRQKKKSRYQANQERREFKEQRTQIWKEATFVFHRTRYLKEECTMFDSAVHQDFAVVDKITMFRDRKTNLTNVLDI